MVAEDHLVAMFPSLRFYAYFEVLHHKRLMETPKKTKKKLKFTKTFLGWLEVVFDLCEKGLT